MTSVPVKREERTARLTVLIDPRKKAIFEQLCAEEDLTSSQMVRRLIRTYIEGRLGRPWTPEGENSSTKNAASATRGTARRRTSRR